MEETQEQTPNSAANESGENSSAAESTSTPTGNKDYEPAPLPELQLGNANQNNAIVHSPAGSGSVEHQPTVFGQRPIAPSKHRFLENSDLPGHRPISITNNTEDVNILMGFID